MERETFQLYKSDMAEENFIIPKEQLNLFRQKLRQNMNGQRGGGRGGTQRFKSYGEPDTRELSGIPAYPNPTDHPLSSRLARWDDLGEGDVVRAYRRLIWLKTLIKEHTQTGRRLPNGWTVSQIVKLIRTIDQKYRKDFIRLNFAAHELNKVDMGPQVKNHYETVHKHVHHYGPDDFVSGTTTPGASSTPFTTTTNDPDDTVADIFDGYKTNLENIFAKYKTPQRPPKRSSGYGSYVYDEDGNDPLPFSPSGDADDDFNQTGSGRSVRAEEEIEIPYFKKKWVMVK